MSLNWDVSTVPDAVRLDSEGGMSGTTHCLIWATMAVGLGRITDANAEEFAARLELWQDIHGAFASGPDGPVRITPADVRAHVGLKCNVSDETRSAWIKRTTADHFRGVPTARKGK